MEEEIDLALEEIVLTMTNYTQYNTTIVNGGTKVFWTPVICNTRVNQPYYIRLAK